MNYITPKNKRAAVLKAFEENADFEETKEFAFFTRDELVERSNKLGLKQSTQYKVDPK